MTTRTISPNTSIYPVVWKGGSTATVVIQGATGSPVTLSDAATLYSSYTQFSVPGSNFPANNFPYQVTYNVDGYEVKETLLSSEGSSAPAPSVKGLVSDFLAASADTPVKRVGYTTDSSGPDLFAIAYDPTNLNNGSNTLWTSWFNERGLFRLQQPTASKWDVPLRIFGPSDNTGFGSNIIEVHRQRQVGGNPTHVFGVNATGRIRSSLYTWTDIPLNTTKFSNDGTGEFDTAQVRWLTDDVLELKGAVVVAGSTLAIGDVIGTLPAGLRPAKVKRVAVGNATGAVNMTFVYPDGRIVNQRASASGAGWISLDNIRL